MEVWDKGLALHGCVRTGPGRAGPRVVRRGRGAGQEGRARARDLRGQLQEVVPALPAGVGAEGPGRPGRERHRPLRPQGRARREGRNRQVRVRAQGTEGRTRRQAGVAGGLRGQAVRQDRTDEGRRRSRPQAAVGSTRRAHQEGPGRGTEGTEDHRRRAGDAVRVQNVRDEAEGRAEPVDLAARRGRRPEAAERPAVGEPEESLHGRGGRLPRAARPDQHLESVARAAHRPDVRASSKTSSFWRT